MTNDGASMLGRTCVVTGATSGLGAVTARVLAERGAEVVVVGRAPERCEATVRQIKLQTASRTVSWMRCDLSSQREVRDLAQEYRSRHQRLDVLVNNAGAVFGTRRLSTDGIEMTFATNHLSQFLLTNLLLDSLKASAAARVVNVSSIAHEQAHIDFDDIECRRAYRPMQVYGKSKLANLYFTYELARRLEGTSVTVNALHPGLVRTNFGPRAGPLGRIVQTLVHLRYRRYSIGAEEGAATIVFLATSPAVDGVTGKYFVDERAVSSAEQSYDQSAARKLWEVSAAMSGLSTTA